jgi:ketol-acid reductoisomerase
MNGGPSGHSPEVAAVPSPEGAAMAALLEEIRTGAFAREWAEEVARGRPVLDAEVTHTAGHPIEEAGRTALGDGPGPGEPPGESRKALSKN